MHVNCTDFKHHVFLATLLFLRLSLQGKSLQDGICLYHQPVVHFCLERILLFLRSMLKLCGYNQFLEISATSKEVMLFYDKGFVLL